MKIVEASFEGTVHAYMLTGNGPRDIRIMKELASKYNHNKLIKIPQTPIKERGLQPTIKTIAYLLDKVTINKYILVIDREHVESVETCRNTLIKHGFEIVEETSLGEKSWYFKARRGGSEIHIYVAVSGCERQKSIECNIAKLIKSRYGEQVKPDKNTIKRWLKNRSLRDIDLIRKTGRRHLERAFPQHRKILKKIARDS